MSVEVTPRMSIHIVTCGRLQAFQACCRSVARALPARSEVVVVVNGGDPETLRWLSSFNHPAFRWHTVPKESLACSRNRVFSLCRGELIHCLDDDVIVPGNLFAQTREYFSRDPGLAIAGGPNLTPPMSSRRARYFGAVMTSCFTAPKAYRRYLITKENQDAESLMFCNLAFHRKRLPLGVRFVEFLRSNEENTFLYECQKRSTKIQYFPELFVYHQRRRDWESFVFQTNSYGFGRAQQWWLHPQSCHVFYLAPALGVLGGIFFLLGGYRFISVYALWGLSLYGLASWVGALCSKEVRALGKWRSFLFVPLTLLVHVSYGVGFLRAWFSEAIRRIAMKVQPPIIKAFHRFQIAKVYFSFRT